MPDPAECLAVLKRLAARPDAAFAEALMRATDAERCSFEVAQQAAEFSERIRDLSLDELQELHDETFGPVRNGTLVGLKAEYARAVGAPRLEAARPRDWTRLLAWLASGGSVTVPAGIVEDLVDLDVVLVAARNPYHHVVAGLYSLLQAARRR